MFLPPFLYYLSITGIFHTDENVISFASQNEVKQLRHIFSRKSIFRTILTFISEANEVRWQTKRD